MNIKQIEDSLNTKYIGKNIIYYETIDSTQIEAKKLTSNGMQNGSILIADDQKEGIGTHGREWLSDAGKNILMTLIIYPDCNISKLEGITIDIANCFTDVIERLYNIKLGIKEPNDLILNDKKIGGILTETRIENEKVKELFIGVGFNVNQEEFPESIKDIATSFRQEFKQEFRREEIIIEFINMLEDILEKKLKIKKSL